MAGPPIAKSQPMPAASRWVEEWIRVWLFFGSLAATAVDLFVAVVVLDAGRGEGDPTGLLELLGMALVLLVPFVGISGLVLIATPPPESLSGHARSAYQGLRWLGAMVFIILAVAVLAFI